MPEHVLLDKASELLDPQEYIQLRQCFALIKDPRFEKNKIILNLKILNT